MSAKRDNKGRFRKGQVGNPKGRPKEVAQVRKLAREYTQEAIETLADLMRNDSRGATRLAAANALLDRGYGKPAQAVEMTVEKLDDTEVLSKTWEIIQKLRNKDGEAPLGMQ